MNLRPYQQAALDGITDSLREKDSTLVVMPTGTGKTRVIHALAARGENVIDLEKLAHQIDIKIADACTRELAAHLQPGTAGQVDHDARQRLVQREHSGKHDTNTCLGAVLRRPQRAGHCAL